MPTPTTTPTPAKAPDINQRIQNIRNMGNEPWYKTGNQLANWSLFLLIIAAIGTIMILAAGLGYYKLTGSKNVGKNAYNIVFIAFLVGISFNVVAIALWLLTK